MPSKAQVVNRGRRVARLLRTVCARMVISALVATLEDEHVAHG